MPKELCKKTCFQKTSNQFKIKQYINQTIGFHLIIKNVWVNSFKKEHEKILSLIYIIK